MPMHCRCWNGGQFLRFQLLTDAPVRLSSTTLPSLLTHALRPAGKKYNNARLLSRSQCRILYTRGSSLKSVHHHSLVQRPSLRVATANPAAAAVAMTSTRAQSGHSHAHHHHHDNAYLTSTNKSDAGVRITRVGLYVNLGMAIGKGVGGWVFNSQALLADAFHSLTDLISDFMTLATVSWSLTPPTERFPFGYGKIESLGSLGVSGLLLVGGIMMGLNSCDALYSEFFSNGHGGLLHAFAHGHGHDHSHIPNLNAAWLAAGSVLVKEWLYRATMKIALERRSSVLASNAVHHRIDSLTGIVAFVAIGGSHFFEDATWLDPVGGLIVSLMVIRAGWTNIGASLMELADVGVDDEMKASVRRSTRKSLAAFPDSSQIEILKVQGHKAGQNYLMEVKLGVPGDWTVDHIGVIERAVRERVGTKVRGVRRVKVRFVEKDRYDKDGMNIERKKDFADEFVATQRSRDPEPEIETDDDEHHDHHGHSHTNGDAKKDI